MLARCILPALTLCLGLAAPLTTQAADLAASAATAQAEAPSLSGRWEGPLSLPNGASIRFVLRVDEAGAAVVDSPDQGGFGIAVADLSLSAGTVRFAVPAVGGRFEGALDEAGTTLTGVLSQGPANMPLVLTRAAETASAGGPARPQHPVEPFPYRTEEVAFDNPVAPGVRLAGTLTLPQGEGPFPAAVLITGSGPQDRDETVFGHKPFLVWADALTRRGVAVLRYDDRGVGASTGDFGAATSADFATDAEAALTHLAGRSDIDSERIGLIGHSEGGTIAPLVESAGADVAWIVMLAGPAVSGSDVLREQNRRLALASGLPEATVATGSALYAGLVEAAVRTADPEEARREIVALLAATGQTEAQAEAAAAQFTSPWIRWFLTHDPSEALRGGRAPMLAVYGGKDLQVPADQSAEALAALRPAAEIVILPDLNHLMQTAETGLPNEYGRIEETLAPEALETVVDWVVARSAD